MNCVLKGENEEQALELLKLTVTDEKELSHLLKYGNENVPNVPLMMKWLFGNDSFDIEKKEDTCSKIAGFQVSMGAHIKKRLTGFQRNSINTLIYSVDFRKM